LISSLTSGVEWREPTGINGITTCRPVAVKRTGPSNRCGADRLVTR